MDWRYRQSLIQEGCLDLLLRFGHLRLQVAPCLRSRKEVVGCQLPPQRAEGVVGCCPQSCLVTGNLVLDPDGLYKERLDGGMGSWFYATIPPPTHPTQGGRGSWFYATIPPPNPPHPRGEGFMVLRNYPSPHPPHSRGEGFMVLRNYPSPHPPHSRGEGFMVGHD